MRIYIKILESKRIIFFIAIMFIIIGIFGYYKIPKQEFPEIDAPAAVITTVYPGASTETIKREVTDKIENEIIDVEGYDYSNSVSKNSVSIVVLRLKVDADVEKSNSQLREKIYDIKNDLPEGVTQINIKTDLVDTADAYYVLINEQGNPYDQEIIDNLEYEISSVSGVTRIESIGDEPLDIIIEVDIHRANQLNITMGYIYSMIESSIDLVPIGDMRVDNTYINLDMDETLSIQDLESILLVSNPIEFTSVTLGDISKIYLSGSDEDTVIKYNGEAGILFAVYFDESINALDIGKDLNEVIGSFKMPNQFYIVTPHFSPDIIKDSVTKFSMSLFIGIALVMVIVFLGMGFRNAVVVSTAIPLTIMIAFSVMYIKGIRLQQISIAALIVSLGMLVDNAIVISDSIQVNIDHKGNTYEAISDGVSEVGVPVLTSTLTTVFAFFPLLLLGGVAGEYIYTLPLIIMISLIASYGVSIFFTPLFSSVLLKPTKAHEKKSRFKNFTLYLLRYFLKKRMQLMIILFLAVIFTIILGMNLGLQFFPYADSDIVYMNIKTENQQDFEYTINKTESIINILNKEEYIVENLASIGNGLPKFYNTLIPLNQSKDSAQIYIRLNLKAIEKEFKSISGYITQLENKLKNQMSGVDISIKQLEIGEPIGSPIVIIISSNNLNELYESSKEIKSLVSEVAGITSVRDDANIEELFYDIAPNKLKLIQYGISEFSIRNEIGLAIGSYGFIDVKIDNTIRDIKLKSNASSVEELRNIKVANQNYQLISLRDLIDINISSEISKINKYERMMSITIYGNIEEGANPYRVESDIKALIEKGAFNVNVKYDGETGKIIQYFGDIGILGIFSLMFILSILLIQFNSIKKVLLILLTIPISSIGSIIGLAITGHALSFMSIFGIVSLFGIVVNNAIVLLDFISKEMKEGYELFFAVENAVSKRYRPIMLTTITTIFGLLPLVFSKSGLFQPMAISLIFGLALSTLLTLIVIPVIFTLMFNDENKSNKNIINLKRVKEAIWKEI